MFLQPALLTLTLIDLARYVDASSFLGGLLHKISLILRPGDRLADRSAERLAWDMVLAVQGTALTQAWYCMRMHSWCHRAEGHERREPPSELKKRSLAVHTQIEGVVFSSFSLPLLWLLASVALVLVGAPLHTYVSTLGLPIVATWARPRWRATWRCWACGLWRTSLARRLHRYGRDGLRRRPQRCRVRSWSSCHACVRGSAQV